MRANLPHDPPDGRPCSTACRTPIRSHLPARARPGRVSASPTRARAPARLRPTTRGTRFTEEPETAPAPRGLTTPAPAPTSPASRARPMRSVPRRSAPRRSAPTPRDPWWFRRRPSPADPRRRCKPPSPYSGTSRRPSRRRARVAKPNTPEEPHGGTIATRTSPRTTTGRTRAGRTTGNAIDRDATRVIRHPRVLRVIAIGVVNAVTDTVIATSITVSTILTTIARGVRSASASITGTATSGGDDRRRRRRWRRRAAPGLRIAPSWRRRRSARRAYNAA